MILQALHSAGYLDISSQEKIDQETEPFRVTLLPGQRVTVDDKWRKLTNIQTAIQAGLLQITSYDEQPTSIVMQEELQAGLGSGSAFEFILDGQGGVLSAGDKGDLHIPFNCTITEASIFADQTGSMVVDFRKSTRTGFPPTAGDSITGGNPLTLSGDDEVTDSTLTGWTKTLRNGEVLRVTVPSSPASVTRVTIVLRVRKTI